MKRIPFLCIFLLLPPLLNAEVIKMFSYHFLIAGRALVAKTGMVHFLNVQSSRVVLLPDQKAEFIAKVEEALIIRIVGGSHGIGIVLI